MSNFNLIDDFASTLSEESMNRVIDSAQNDLLKDTDIVYLANTLAKSGNKVILPENIIAADIPSTGGPSSLTTLICPLVLKEAGFWVPKLGVPGRPAGGIDILYQIPGYKIEYQKSELDKCLLENGYCHFLAGENYAPADAIFFRHRAKVNATAVPPLVIASILSKKIAAGLKITGLDIRVSKNGNFGKNLTEALKNAKRFIKVARIAEIRAVCMFNDLNFMQQPYIGRGEALVALMELFTQNPSNSLKDHFDRCISMALELVDLKKIDLSIIAEKIKIHFKSNILAQNGSWDGFLKKATKVRNEHINNINASSTGYLRVDLNKLKYLIVSLQNKYNTSVIKFSDPCGVIFKKEDNELVHKGESILTFRCKSEDFVYFKNGLINSISYVAKKENRFDYQIVN